MITLFVSKLAKALRSDDTPVVTRKTGDKSVPAPYRLRRMLAVTASLLVGFGHAQDEKIVLVEVGRSSSRVVADSLSRSNCQVCAYFELKSSAIVRPFCLLLIPS
jgi:hypothetical protein